MQREQILYFIMSPHLETGGGLGVENLTPDWGVVGSSLTKGPVLCSWARHFILCLVLGQRRKTFPDMIENIYNFTLKIFINKGHQSTVSRRDWADDNGQLFPCWQWLLSSVDDLWKLVWTQIRTYRTLIKSPDDNMIRHEILPSLQRVNSPHLLSWLTMTRQFKSFFYVNGSYHGKWSKISNTFLFLFFNKNVGFQGWNSQNACQNSQQRRTWSDCFLRSSLIWVCTVFLRLFYRHLVFEILEHFMT